MFRNFLHFSWNRSYLIFTEGVNATTNLQALTCTIPGFWEITEFNKMGMLKINHKRKMFLIFAVYSQSNEMQNSAVLMIYCRRKPIPVI